MNKFDQKLLICVVSGVELMIASIIVAAMTKNSIWLIGLFISMPLSEAIYGIWARNEDSDGTASEKDSPI